MSLLLIFGGAFALLMLAVRAALEAGDQSRRQRQARLLLVAVPLWVGSWALVPGIRGPDDRASTKAPAPAVWMTHSDR